MTPAPDGSAETWYPYPFLDPNGSAGWTGVLTYVVVMLAVLIGIGAGIIAIGRHRARRHGVDVIGAGDRAAARAHVVGMVDGSEQHFAVAQFATTRAGLLIELVEVWTGLEQDAPEGTRSAGVDGELAG